MKYLSRLLTLVILVSAGLFYAGCDGSEDDKPEEELQLDKLRGTWTIESVVNDAVDRTGEYPNMTLSITGTFSDGGTYNYNSDADDWPSVSPWKGVDTWKFKSGSVDNTITRQSDLQDMTYSLTESDGTLTIEFDYSGPGFNNGRTESVSGNWIFVFTK